MDISEGSVSTIQETECEKPYEDYEEAVDETQTVEAEQQNSFSLAKCFLARESSFIDLSDFIIVGVDGVEHKIHRLILGCYSLHFRETIFAHPQNKECKEGKYKFSEEIDPTNVLENVIEYMYTDQLSLSPTSSVAYYKIADFLQMPELLKCLQEYIHETELEFFTVDELFSLPIDFLVKWLSSNELRVDKEEQVYEIVASIANLIHDNKLSIEPNSTHELFECVRFSQVGDECLRKANKNMQVPRQTLLDHILNRDSNEIKFTARDSYCDSPLIIEAIKIYGFDVNSSRDIAVKIKLKEYNSSQLDGFCSVDKELVYASSTPVLRASGAQWKRFNLKNTFEWNTQSSLLFEFSSSDYSVKDNIQMWFIAKEDIERSTIIWQSDDNIQNEIGMKSKNCHNYLPEIQILGRIRNKSVILDTKKNGKTSISHEQMIMQSSLGSTSISHQQAIRQSAAISYQTFGSSGSSFNFAKTVSPGASASTYKCIQAVYERSDLKMKLQK